MSAGSLPDNPEDLCLACARLAIEAEDRSDAVFDVLMECESIPERANRCLQARGIVCPFSGAAELCDVERPGRIYATLKRVVDIIGGFIGSALVVLMLPLVGAAIKAQSPGSVFFAQERVGRGGETIRVLKFRTMHERTSDEAKWASEEEDRIFGFGSFMRRLHIDEFPQFINVLRGEMSLVGPRPEQVPIVERLREKIPNYDLRHRALPGITGWSQVHQRYADSELSSWLKTAFDLYYLKHQSLGMDLLVHVRTVPKLFRGPRAVPALQKQPTRSRTSVKPTA
jgi:lipopolysaccharide/colanic/teichoic acid biosynthesis glycosyltransferase